MSILSIPDSTFKRLAERAAALNITVEELVTPALNDLVATTLEVQSPGDWQRQFDDWMNEVSSRAGRYPLGFQLDDTRESIYEGCGE